MSFKFTWAHPAKEVYVTGSFDGWTKSVKLEKKGEVFEKVVPLPHVVDKIIYKFVVDGDWTYDHTAKTEPDHEGNVNNVLFPADIVHESGAISSVAPTSSTIAMAGAQPLETPGLNAPGAFPVTPAADEVKDLSVNPIPATAGQGNPISLAPGEPVPHSSTITTNTLTSGVHDDPELVAADQKISVAPIPATGGTGNPVSLAPGEQVPHASTLTGHTIHSNVKLDQASYEKSDSGAPVLPPVLTPGSEREAAGAPIFGLGAGTLIPESSLPMGVTPASANENVGPTMSSVAPTSTTAQLAAAVPLEPRGTATVLDDDEPPAIVKDSQRAANASPEASANPEAVAEKSALEEELKAKVPEEPATSTSGTFGKSEAGIIGVAAGGLAVAGAAVGAAISSVAPNSSTMGLAAQQPVQERGVPEIVKESQQAAHASPEAAANPEAVQEKSQVEQELQAAVSKAPATSESGTFGKSERGITGAIAGGAAAAGAAVAAGAYALREKTKETTGTDPVSVLPTSVQKQIDGNKATTTTAPVTSATITNVAEDTRIPRQFALGETPRVPESDAQVATSVPAEVVASQKEAHVGPEASANPEAVQEKSALERELLSKVKPVETAGAPAPSTSAALTSTAPAATSASGAPQLSPIAAAAPIDLDSANGGSKAGAVSGDVSPMTKVDQPTVTTGVATARIPSASASDPKKRQSFMDRLSGSPDSSKAGASDAENKKKNRKSFFGKLKDKLSK